MIDTSPSQSMPFDPLNQQWSTQDFKTHRLFVDSDKDHPPGLFFDKVHSSDETGKGVLGKWFVGWKEHRLPDKYSIEKITRQLDNITTEVVNKEKSLPPQGTTEQKQLNELNLRTQTLEKLKANLVAHNIYITEYNERFALGNKSWVACPHHKESLSKLDEKIGELKLENARITSELIRRNSQDPSIYANFLQELQKKIKEDPKRSGDGLFREAGSNSRIEEILSAFMLQHKVLDSEYVGGDIIAMGTASKRLFTKIMPSVIKERLKKTELNKGSITVEEARQRLMNASPEDREIIKQLAATLKLTNETYWTGKKTGGMSSLDAMLIAFTAAEDFISKPNMIMLVQNFDKIFA